MRAVWWMGAAALLAGCANTPNLAGSFGAPSFAALQQMCGTAPADYGSDAQPVYTTFLDAYVAHRHGHLSKDAYCEFQASIAQHYETLAKSSDPQARNQWVSYFLDQRAQAISWRAAVDPTLRGG
jgi:hypothetical protein